MTVSAPLNGVSAPPSEGKPCEMQETMEEVQAGATVGAPSEAPRQVATESHRFDAVPAPLSAPREVLVRGAEFTETRLVYGLVDPLAPDVVRYVGQTTRAPIARYLSHVSPASNNLARACWVLELKDEGRMPDMVLLEHVADEADIDRREMWWIESLKAVGEADLNAPVPKRFRGAA